MSATMASVACASLLGAQAVAVVPISTVGAAVHRAILSNGRTVVVKLHMARPGRADLEKRALTCLAAHTDVRTPRILASGRTPDADAIVLADLGTANLGQLHAAGLYSRESVLKTIGSLLARIHQLPLDCGPGNPCELRPHVPAEFLTGRCPDDPRRVADSVTRRAVEVLVRSPPRSWCHGDLHPANVIPVGLGLDAASLHVVDLEQFSCSIPEYDVAQSLVTSDALDSRGHAALLSGYATRLDGELLTSLSAYQALRGWAYAATRERRDVALWTRRLDLALRPFEQ